MKKKGENYVTFYYDNWDVGFRNTTMKGIDTVIAGYTKVNSGSVVGNCLPKSASTNIHIKTTWHESTSRLFTT